MNQSCPGWTCWSGRLVLGWSRTFMASVRPSGRLSGQVVRAQMLCSTGRMTTSASPGSSKSALKLTWSALASGTSTSRPRARLPVSTRLIVDTRRVSSRESSAGCVAGIASVSRGCECRPGADRQVVGWVSPPRLASTSLAGVALVRPLGDRVGSSSQLAHFSPGRSVQPRCRIRRITMRRRCWLAM